MQLAELNLLQSAHLVLLQSPHLVSHQSLLKSRIDFGLCKENCLPGVLTCCCIGFTVPAGSAAERNVLQPAPCKLGSLGGSPTPRHMIAMTPFFKLDRRMHPACAGLQALGSALMPATELETGTKLRIEDLAAACRQAHSEIAKVVEDVEEFEPGDSPDEDSDVEPVCPHLAHVLVCKECRSTFV